MTSRTPTALQRALLQRQDAEALERLHDRLDWMDGHIAAIIGRIEAGTLSVEMLPPSSNFYTQARAAFAIYSRGGSYGGSAAELYILRLQALAARVSRTERAFRAQSG